MEISVYHLIEGARAAEGLTVIIDVFRAFSLECYLYAMGAGEVRPVGTIEETFAWKEKDPGCVLAKRVLSMAAALTMMANGTDEELTDATWAILPLSCSRK